MDAISNTVSSIAPFVRAVRRDLHRHPETAWMEFRTAALVAEELAALGFRLTMGAEAADPAEYRFKFDDPVRLDAFNRALAEGANPDLARSMLENGTAIWADIAGTAKGESENCGSVLAFRFDIDANKLDENTGECHRPSREGFASVHKGAMHACGHDGHTALGLGLARALKEMRANFSGRVRLIFQPAEEGGGGALPMLRAGALKDVDCLVGLHLGINTAEVGEIICGSTHFLSTSKFDIFFEGREAHAGLKPHEGKNALMAACSAALAMQGTTRHGSGPSRICVGRMSGGQARNVIPARAEIHGETRGSTDEINSFVLDEVMRMAEGAARMWNCSCRSVELGHCPGGASSLELAREIAAIAASMPRFHKIETLGEFGASEDFTWFMNETQKKEGQAAFIQLGAGQTAGHHNCAFDFDETALEIGLELLTRIALRKLS